MVYKQDVFFAPTERMLTLHIALPQRYAQTDERYPVMYFFDGHNLFSDSDATYGKSWGLARFLEGWEKDMIIVGIECNHEGNMRLVEYCPYAIDDRFLGRIDGMGAQTLDWMAHTLKPMIDSRYRTYSFREATGIGGSSMGGLMSLYGIIRHNDIFSKAACLSSAIFPCMAQLTREIEQNALSDDTRVYLSWGTREASRRRLEDDMQSSTARANRALAERMSRRGVNTRLYAQRGGRHCEADWEKQLPLAMDYLWLDR